MAFNPSPKVAAARALAGRFRKNKVVILMIDEEAGTMEYASYGQTRRECAEAKRLGDAVYEAAYRHLSQEAVRGGARRCQ